MNSTTQLQQHVLFSELESVIDICKPLNKMGIQGFIFMRHFPDGSFIDLSNQIKWSEFFLQRFMQEKYVYSNIEDHMNSMDGVSLWALNMDNVIWQEGGEHFDFGNGISLSRDIEQRYKDTFCFYSDLEKTELNQYYLNHLPLLWQFCDYFLEKAAPIVQKGYQHKLSTPDAYLQSNHLMDSCLHTHKDVCSWIKYDFDSISTKEKHSLYLAAQGFTAEEIANLIHVSKRTVESRLNNLRQKLDCKNLAHAIYLCTRHHVI